MSGLRTKEIMDQENTQPSHEDDTMSAPASPLATKETPARMRLDDAIEGGLVKAYTVQFGLSTGYGRVPADSLRFSGVGEVHISESELLVSGKRRRPFWFGIYEAHIIDLSAVINVSRSGRSIRIEINSELPRRRFVQFTTESEAEAVDIQAHLPKEQTPEFSREQAETTAFHERLNKLSPKGPVTPVLVAINLVVFVAMCIGGAGFIRSNVDVITHWGSNFDPLTMSGHWWRLFTSLFIHFGAIHLALNMWVLLQSGRFIERLFGSLRFLLLYVFAGMSGSIASLLWNPVVNSAGASGAIFGLFGGLLAFVANPRNGVPRSVMKQHLSSTVIFAAYNLFYGFAHSGIDNAAHIGGLLGGLAAGFLLARPLNDTARARPHLERVAASLLGGVVLVGLAAWPLVHPSEAVRREQQFQLMLSNFSAQEKTALDATQKLGERARLGQLSTADLLVAARNEVLPKWDALYRETAAVNLRPADKNYPLQRALLRYLDDRRDWLRLATEAAAQNDGELMRQANAAKQDLEASIAELRRIQNSG
jgi:rhomboid protease GluP